MNVKSIIILGGGSAGWMTATTLIRLFPNKKITLIESPNTPIVGVGESTLGQINWWLQLCNIKDEEFMKDCDASYKLSIKFIDFYKKNSGEFHYPFGDTFENGLIAGKNTWYFKKMLDDSLSVNDYANFLYPGMALVNNNTFGENEKGEIGNFNLKMDSAYHFDAIKFGASLKKNICIPEGVQHIEENIKTVEQDEDGNIISLNKKHKADLYIDCTGFKSYLIGEILKVPFKSYNDLLPNDSALATQIDYTDKEKELVPYTSCWAIENGWVWRIPSWKRIGTGYVYSSKFVSDEEAQKEFINHLNIKYNYNASNNNFKKIKMKVGLHEKLFEKNVVAIGLAAGFIEPLESNGLYTVHQFLLKLVRFLKKENINQFDKDTYNLMCKEDFETFAEFVSLHYYLSKRNDTLYWKTLTNKSIQNLKLHPNLDINKMYYSKINNGYHSTDGIHCIATGLHQFPIDEYEICLRNNTNDIKNFIKNNIETSIKSRQLMVEAWNAEAKKKPKLIEVLKKIHEERN
jgi:tryptophan halogenase